MARELSCAASVFKSKRRTLGVWSNSQKYKTRRRRNTFCMLQPWFSGWTPQPLCCLFWLLLITCYISLLFGGKGGVSISLSLFPASFLWLFPWVQNAYSLTWLQFFIFFLISSHFLLHLLLCNLATNTCGQFLNYLTHLQSISRAWWACHPGYLRALREVRTLTFPTSPGPQGFNIQWFSHHLAL